ncbi:MAG: DUF692 domain-containing protein [Pyrinomonadaceae bacterium]|nr:DUF692 domain-containing protein [Pyrinomonadaceae bacterium]
MTGAAPMVGLLYNPAIPLVLDALGARVDFVEVIPDRLWYDFGVNARSRFSHAQVAIDELRRYANDRRVIGHGIGLSLPSAMPLDQRLLDEVVASHRSLNYQWYSEHLSMFLVPGGSIPNAQAGMGLPVVLDDETLELVGNKVRQLGEALELPILLENSTIFSAIPEPDMSEPAFFNRLHVETGCGMLLDLHNLYANTLNLGISADEYLSEINPEIVREIHLAGGDWLKGHYTDSHSRKTPSPVWEWAHKWAPRFPNLAAITFEYHESYHRRIGIEGLAEEIELMHELAEQVSSQRLVEVA